jgi:hypothetical protein
LYIDRRPQALASFVSHLRAYSRYSNAVRPIVDMPVMKTQSVIAIMKVIRGMTSSSAWSVVQFVCRISAITKGAMDASAADSVA